MELGSRDEHDMSAVRTDRVTKKYGDVTAVRDLSLRVDPGEMFGLIGPDGAGKTTTIRLMCGLLKPDSGTVRVLGHDPVKRPSARSRESLGYLSQRFSLYGDLSIDENIAFFAEIHGLSMRDAAITERRERLLELTQLAPFRSRLADRLSGGMKQKLALACTLVHEPESSCSTSRRPASIRSRVASSGSCSRSFWRRASRF